MNARHRLAAAMLTWSAVVAACGSPPPPAPAGGDRSVDPATAGSLAGRAVFAGTPPAAETIRMTADAACVAAAGPTPPSDRVLIAADGGLQNVFVYVKEGLDPVSAFPIPVEPVRLDQHGCVYAPRVLGVRAGQPLEIANSDDTLHNVHAMPMLNRDFNLGMPRKAMTLTQTFTVPEVMVRFKCNVHPWMDAYVGVVAHPLFAVTDGTGAFEIAGVPPGTYTLEAWHERFGTRTARVTLGARGRETASFTFAATPRRP